MYKAYKVGSNETIKDVSKKYNITDEQLIELNGLTREITEGELIVVPNYNSIFNLYTVVKGDNLYDIARRYNTKFEYLLEINGLDKDDYIYPNQQILVPKENIEIYVTDNNDSINDVLNRLGITVDKLLQDNRNIILKEEQLIVKSR